MSRVVNTTTGPTCATLPIENWKEAAMNSIETRRAVDAEVTVTLRGRVVHDSGQGRIVVEYLRENGFADRISVDPGPDVTVEPAPEPSSDVIAQRQEAHWRVAAACMNLIGRARALVGVPYRDRLSADRLTLVARAEEIMRGEHK